MQGSSRASAAHGQRALDALLVGGPGRTVAYAGLADELFSVCAALESSAALRRALTDPTREASAKAQLANRLFGDKLSAPAVQLVDESLDMVIHETHGMMCKHSPPWRMEVA